MSRVEQGDTVTIIYDGKLDNGEIFKSVTKDKPLIMTLGNADAPPTLEQALLGLAVGNKKTVRVPPEEGYGPRHKNLLQQVDKNTFGSKLTPKPGMILSLTVEKNGEPHQVPATVIKISNEIVTVDYNHPLAGHHLTYEVTITDIQKDHGQE